MQFRHSVKAKTLCVILVIVLLQMIFSIRSVLRTAEESRLSRLTQVEQAFQMQCQELNQHILLLRKSVQQLALQGEMYLTVQSEWRPDPVQFVARVLEETPEAVGGGLWFEPYRDSPIKKRSSTYFFRDRGKLVFDPLHESDDYNYPDQIWYTTIKSRALSPLSVVWTPPYMDNNARGRIPMITLGCGLFQHDALVGMVTLDWELSDMVRRVSVLLPTAGSFAVFADLMSDRVLVNTRDKELSFGKSALAIPWLWRVGEAQAPHVIEGIPSIALMRTLDNGMALALVMPEDELFAPVRRDLYNMLFLQTGFTLLLLFVTWYLLHRFISTPVLRIVEKAAAIGAGNFNTRIHICDKGELGTLATVLNTMTENLQKHIAAMGCLTQEKERIAAELDVATSIQTAMLPCIFPAFPSRTQFDLYAIMRPAREVGGDFYDFFLVDERHVALIIADVSGKGVPAALFMVIAKTLLKNHLQSGLSPSDALQATNNQLCENNSMDMFVTVWVGLLTFDSGHVRYSNAGHNKPLVQRAGEACASIESEHSFVLGGMRDINYTEGHFWLFPGDRLVLYTDGVNEAENSTNEQFGMERFCSTLDTAGGIALKEVVANLLNSVDEFAGEAPQTDDITLLLLEYMGGVAPKDAIEPDSTV